MRPFAISSLMAVVFGVGVGLAALRHASQTWAELLSTLLALTLGYAVIAVVYRRGREQAWWFGFALFVGGYQLFALAASSGLASPPATTVLLGYLQASLVPSRPMSMDLERLKSVSHALQMKERLFYESGVHPPPRALTDLQEQRASVEAKIHALELSNFAFLLKGRSSGSSSSGTTDPAQFLRVGHCLFAFLAGLLGAALACRAQGHTSRVRSEPV